MARQNKCECGICPTCRNRQYQQKYRGAYPEKKSHCVYNRNDTEITTTADDCKELEEKFPWLRIKLR